MLGFDDTQAFLQEIAAIAEQRYEKVRFAVTTWLVWSRRLGIIKDIRLLIGTLMWQSKEDVIWEK